MKEDCQSSCFSKVRNATINCDFSRPAEVFIWRVGDAFHSFVRDFAHSRFRANKGPAVPEAKRRDILTSENLENEILDENEEDGI